jgi:hypothetical protein
MSEKKLNNNQKSQNHLTKGGLRDTMLDDVEDFTNMDMVSLGCVRIITDSDSTV